MGKLRIRETKVLLVQLRPRRAQVGGEVRLAPERAGWAGQGSAGIFHSTEAPVPQRLTGGGLTGATFNGKSNTDKRSPLSQSLYSASGVPMRKSQAGARAPFPPL